MLEAYLGKWFDAYHGDFEHMIWRIFLDIWHEFYVVIGVVSILMMMMY